MHECLDNRQLGLSLAERVLGESIKYSAGTKELDCIQVFAHDIVMQAVAGIRQQTYPPPNEEADCPLYASLAEQEVTEVRAMLGTSFPALQRYLRGEPITTLERPLLRKPYKLSKEVSIVGTPPDGFISSEAIADHYDSNPRQIERLLMAKMVDTVAVESRWETGYKRAYDLWFSSQQSFDYFDQNPPLKCVTRLELTRREVSHLIDLAQSYTYKLAETLSASMTNKFGRDGRETKVCDEQGVAKILQYMARISFAHSTDVSFGQLCIETNESFALTYAKNHEGYIPIKKRKHPDHNRKGIEKHVTSVQADDIRAAYRALYHPAHHPLEVAAEPREYMSLAEIADAANVGITYLCNSLLPEECEKFVLLHTVRRGSASNAKGLPTDAATTIIERIGLRPLPANLVPRKIVQLRSSLTQNILKHRLCRMQPEHHVIERAKGFNGRVASCYNWKFLQDFEERYGIPDMEFPISYDDLPASESDMDEVRTLYARMIHGVYIPRTVDKETASLDLASYALGLGKNSIKKNIKERGFSLYPEDQVPVIALSELLPGVANLGAFR